MHTQTNTYMFLCIYFYSFNCDLIVPTILSSISSLFSYFSPNCNIVILLQSTGWVKRESEIEQIKVAKSEASKKNTIKPFEIKNPFAKFSSGNETKVNITLPTVKLPSWLNIKGGFSQLMALNSNENDERKEVESTEKQMKKMNLNQQSLHQKFTPMLRWNFRSIC